MQSRNKVFSFFLLGNLELKCWRIRSSYTLCLSLLVFFFYQILLWLTSDAVVLLIHHCTCIKSSCRCMYMAYAPKHICIHTHSYMHTFQMIELRKIIISAFIFTFLLHHRTAICREILIIRNQNWLMNNSNLCMKKCQIYRGRCCVNKSV